MIKRETLVLAEKIAADAGVAIVDRDLERPWGGSFYFDEAEIERFAAAFFPAREVPLEHGKLSPKFLIVGPEQRLSWQYHHRRSEHWRVLKGPVAVIVSDTDEQPEPRTLQEGEEIQIAQGQRHRLVGLEGWGVVAEIWTHTDPDNPSDEDDIVRLADDYKRT